ncbi:hypothetical protein AB9F26_09290 [Falsihalocynthiibacter sp. BN13B15]|uniref:hypothetical protein n=1 Tax=Falsihalocynthiibacter sp. BN13B15 TaxID=3240871 RepID=UPI00350FEC29
MDNNNREQRRIEQRDADVRKLRALEQKAVQSGEKLRSGDRLKAAFHLTRAWSQANKEGLRKEVFQDRVLARLKRPHGKRQEFRLSNWKLRRGEDPKTQDLTEKYKDKSTPHRSLEPYFVGITVAAEHCGANADDWKINMIRDFSIWSRTQNDLDVAPLDDRPAETLAILLNALCAELGSFNGLAETFEVIDRMSCRWDMFEKRLVACEGFYMDQLKFISSPSDRYYGTEIEAMFPLPSVPLLRVPYAVGTMEFELAPDALLRPLDDDENRRYKDVARMPPEFFPENAPGLERAYGNLFFYREVGLAIVPDGRGGFEGNLESRPYVEVEFDEAHPFAGRHQIKNGHMIDLDSLIFLATEFDGKYRFPRICAQDGTDWRLNFPQERPQQYQLTERYPETTGWIFDKDPVRTPGETVFSTEYICFTPVEAADVRHWFAQDLKLEAPWNGDFGPAHVWPECPWPTVDTAEKKSPPLYELNFPDRSFATSIESSLHDGSIEKALQLKIDSLQKQTARLQADWHATRERHSNALLRRWRSDSEANNPTPKDLSHE